MERLGVKSLAGLNLREALEALRRQALRDGTGAEAANEHMPASPAAAPAGATAATASTAPRYFDEEDDDADIIFSDEDEAEDLEAEAAEDDDELDEVPDFGSPPAEPPVVEPVAADADQTPTAAAGEREGQTPAGSGRAARILTHMRGVRGGGVASTQQRSAFKNIVVAELGEPKAKALIAAIWRITPEKLGPEQLDALNNWGKRETFADDTELVLAAVKAERESEGAGAASEPAEAPRAAPTRATPRRASRATPTGGA